MKHNHHTQIYVHLWEADKNNYKTVQIYKISELCDL
jgi:hypothetical protein